MKLTVHVDTFNCTAPCCWAELRIDPKAGTWLCLIDVGLGLPESGTLETQGHSLFVCASGRIYCILEDIVEAADGAVRSNTTGTAQWCGNADLPPGAGHWHSHADCDDDVELVRKAPADPT